MSWKDTLAKSMEELTKPGNGGHTARITDKPGKYVLKVSHIKYKQTNGKPSKELFESCFEVLKSQQIEKGIDPYMPGTIVQDACFLGGEWQEYAVRSFISNLRAMLGISDKNFEDLCAQDKETPAQIINQAVSEEQPLAGLTIEATTYRQPTKKQKDTDAPFEDWNIYLKIIGPLNESQVNKFQQHDADTGADFADVWQKEAPKVEPKKPAIDLKAIAARVSGS